MPHKRAFDYQGLRNLPQLQTTGGFADHVDAWLGIPYDFLEGLSIRHQRSIVKQRITEILKSKNQAIRTSKKSPTRPIDTYTNTRNFLKQMERNSPNQGMNQGTNSRRAQTTMEQNLLKPKPSATGSEFAEMSTTVGKPSEMDHESPFLKGRNGGLGTQRETERLSEVAEFPANTF